MNNPTEPGTSGPLRTGGGALVAGGAFAILLGIAAVVASQSLRLDAEQVLSGGFYVKDGWRAVLTFTGAALVALGLLVALLAGLGANRGVVGGLLALTAVVGIVAVGEGLILFAAYQDKQQEATETAPVEESPPAESEPDPVPRQAARGDYTVSCGSGGCFENGTPVYPVSEGEACTTGGTDGAWGATGSIGNEFICAPTNPDGSVEGGPPGADPAARAVCSRGECRQDGKPVEVSEGEACDLGGNPFGTWVRVAAEPSNGLVTYECRGD